MSDEENVPPGAENIIPPVQPQQPPVDMQQQFQLPAGFQWVLQNQANVAPAQHVQKVALTPFWPSDPRAWFRLAEATFNRLNVQDVVHRFELVLPAIPEATVSQLRDILAAADSLENPYLTLKTELIRQFSPNVLEQLNRIVFAPELGGQQPSQLMRALLNNLPAGEPAGLLFKHLFLLRLPEDMRDQVAKKIETLDAKELAEYADDRWHVRNARRPAGKAIAAVGVPLAAESKAEGAEELAGAVAAIQVNKDSRRGGRSRGGRRNNNSNPKPLVQPFICFNHCKWGEKTWECQDPRNCKFPGNDKAGGQ